MNLITIEDIREYWDKMINNTQVLRSNSNNYGGELKFNDFSLTEFEIMKNWRYSLVNSIFKIIVNESKNYNEKKILEIGCGIGIDAMELIKRGGKVTGIDLSPQSIKLAERYRDLNNYEGTFQLGNAEKLEFEKNFFDIIWSFGVLHHTPNIKKAIDEVYRVLKPGGIGYIGLYYKYSYLMFFHKILKQNLEFQSEDAPIINCYSTKDIKKMWGHKFIIKDIQIIIPPTPTCRKGFKEKIYNMIFVKLWNHFPILTNYFGAGIYFQIFKPLN